MRRKIGVSLAQRLDVSNFLKDVSNVPKSILEYFGVEDDLQSFSKDP